MYNTHYSVPRQTGHFPSAMAQRLVPFCVTQCRSLGNWNRYCHHNPEYYCWYYGIPDCIDVLNYIAKLQCGKITVDHIFFAYTKFSRISRGHLQSRKYCARERSKFGKYFRQPVSAFAPGHLNLHLHCARLSQCFRYLLVFLS